MIFLVTSSQSSRSGIWIASLDDPASRKRLIAADAQAIVAGGMLLYLNDLALMAQPTRSETFEPSGRAVVVGLQAGRGPLGQTLRDGDR